VRAAGIRRGAITGDLVMRGPDPEGCVALARQTGWPVVLGNTDRRVALERPRARSHPASGRVGSRSWTYRRLSADDLEWLAELPLVARLTLGPHRIAVVHGLPDDLNSAPEVDTPEDELLALADELDADAVVTGHTHQPHLRRVAGRLFLNPGSVGEAVAGERRPAWAWLAAGPDGLEATLERVPQPLAALRQ